MAAQLLTDQLRRHGGLAGAPPGGSPAAAAVGAPAVPARLAPLQTAVAAAIERGRPLVAASLLSAVGVPRTAAGFAALHVVLTVLLLGVRAVGGLSFEITSASRQRAAPCLASRWLLPRLLGNIHPATLLQHAARVLRADGAEAHSRYRELLLRDAAFVLRGGS